MKHSAITKILLDNYRLSELEERLDVTLADLEYGLDEFIHAKYPELVEMLQEDLFLD